MLHNFFSKKVDEKFAFIMEYKVYDIAYVDITNICKGFRTRDTLINNNWASSREKTVFGVSDKASFKPVSSATETS